MQKKNNTHPLVKFMNKRITVAMLEAHFNALPELLRYIIKKADTDIEARIALNNFTIECEKERQCLDPAEAVYGLAANILQLSDSPSNEEKSLLSNLVAEFCEANGLGKPREDWATRLKMINPGE